MRSMKRVTKTQLRKALKQSIEKWKDIKDRVQHSPEHPCALCDLFDGDGVKANRCKGCPLHDPDDAPRVCCWEWSRVSTAVEDLIKRLKRERVELEDC